MKNKTPFWNDKIFSKSILYVERKDILQKDYRGRLTCRAICPPHDVLSLMRWPGSGSNIVKIDKDKLSIRAMVIG